MPHEIMNSYGQPIGVSLPEWTARPYPDGNILQGRYCRLEHIQPQKHADSLYEAYQQTQDGRDWTYLSVGPFNDKASFEHYLQQLALSTDPLHYAVVDQLTGNALGTLALMRIDAANGSIEVGFVIYSSALKHSRIATEAQFLLMEYAFEKLGYRRYEWKCDSLNAPSRSAALRLGFQFEGIFRYSTVYKGRSRDTAWFSIISDEWSNLKQAYVTWLDESNFDEYGRQRIRLSQLTQQEPENS